MFIDLFQIVLVFFKIVLKIKIAKQMDAKTHTCTWLRLCVSPLFSSCSKSWGKQIKIHDV